MNDEILKITQIPNELFEYWNNFWKFGIVKECIIDIGYYIGKMKIYRTIYSTYKF